MRKQLPAMTRPATYHRWRHIMLVGGQVDDQARRRLATKLQAEILNATEWQVRDQVLSASAMQVDSALGAWLREVKHAK